MPRGRAQWEGDRQISHNGYVQCAGHDGACVLSQHSEAEAGGWRVQGQSGLHSKTVSKTSKLKKVFTQHWQIHTVCNHHIQS
jgi:hypothetical protein